MKRPVEHDYKSYVGYTRALEDYCDAVDKERDAAMYDANQYRWLSDNSAKWSWLPSKYNETVVSGFACNGDGYLGFNFDTAVTKAKESK